MVGRKSLQNPIHHWNYFLLWSREIIHGLFKSYLNYTRVGEPIGEGWDQVTHKNFKKYRKTRKHEHKGLVQSVSFSARVGGRGLQMGL